MTTHTEQAAHVLTILAVGDLDRARGFYESAFGWRRAVDAPVYAEYTLPGGMRFGLYQRGGFEKNTGEPCAEAPGRGTTSTELYLFVADLDGGVARAVEAGARLLSPASRRGWGDVVAYLADPDGNVIALVGREGVVDRP